jgi:hypothetical protein
MATELRLVGDADMARDASFIEQVKAALDLPADAHLELQHIRKNPQGGHAVEYVAPAMKIEGAEFGAADGVVVDARVQVSLHFDARGALVASQIKPVDERRLRLMKDQIQKLAAAGEIYAASPGEAIDVDTLRVQRKSWYVETDAQGRKRLKRAFMT